MFRLIAFGTFFLLDFNIGGVDILTDSFALICYLIALYPLRKQTYFMLAMVASAVFLATNLIFPMSTLNSIGDIVPLLFITIGIIQLKPFLKKDGVQKMSMYIVAELMTLLLFILPNLTVALVVWIAMFITNGLMISYINSMIYSK